MSKGTRRPRGIRAIPWWILSVPIYVKILGIGVLVASVFAVVMIFFARPMIARTLYSIHEARARASTVALAAMLERPVAIEDLFMVRQHLANTMLAFPDVRYGVVYDPEGRPIAHTFDGELPAALRRPPVRATASSLFVVGDGAGQIFDVTEPIQGGHVGSLRVGTSDEAVAVQLTSLTRSVWLALLLCLVLGQGLALLLASILTRPIRQLVKATDLVRLGRFEHRAEVLWADEIGDLTVAFNQMAAALEGYRLEVQHKEEARQVLIKRLVQAQEDERRCIALELHDELGQSLMAVLLSIHGLERSGDLPAERANELETQIRLISDEVRAIARRMRPSLLDHGGLEVALESYVEETAALSEIPIDYQRLGGAEPERLPNEVEVTLFRIAQESLTNVLRHSAASQASIVLARAGDAVSLLVEDDGVGFNLSCLEDRRGCGGLGLMGMQERAVLLGGRFSVTSAPGHGTTVRVEIPTDLGRSS
jgi:signal transduction histidine kinase